MGTINYTIPSGISLTRVDDMLYNSLVKKYGKVQNIKSCNERCISCYKVMDCGEVVFELHTDGRIHVTTEPCYHMDRESSSRLVLDIVRKSRDYIIECENRREQIDKGLNISIIVSAAFLVLSFFVMSKYATACYCLLLVFLVVLKGFNNLGHGRK